MNRAVGAGTGLRFAVSGRKLAEPRLVELVQPFAVVGRADRADVSLEDSDISFRHAFVQVLDGQVFCVDLGSKSGVFWGDKRRSAGWLRSRDALCIGSYSLELVWDSPADCSRKSAAASSNPLEQGLGASVGFPHYELEFFDDSLPEPVHPIDRRITLIGRHPGCTVRLDDRSVSGVHCALVLTADGLWLVDLLGKDGTRVDERPVRCCLLENGSELAVGVYLMSVWQHGFVPAAAPASARQDVADAQAPAGELSERATANSKADDLDWLGTLFSVERHGQTLIVVPTINGGMFRYAKLQTEANALRRKLEGSSVRSLVIDLHALEYLGSEVIGAIVALARKAEEVGGRAVLCSAVPHLKEALLHLGLHRLWPLFPSRTEALAAVEKYR